MEPVRSCKCARVVQVYRRHRRAARTARAASPGWTYRSPTGPMTARRSSRTQTAPLSRFSSRVVKR
ncbi:hypothetical protein GCM10007198_25870 [Microbacterium aerolatum]|nr:hypothetical protein GCM10007198_25870 [Microbacterium aerolatum]